MFHGLHALLESKLFLVRVVHFLSFYERNEQHTECSAGTLLARFLIANYQIAVLADKSWWRKDHELATSFEISSVTIAVSLLASGSDALSLAHSEVGGHEPVP